MSAHRNPLRGSWAILLARASRGLLLSAALLSWAGCSRPDVPLQPVYRLVDLLETPLAKEAPAYCDINDDFRQAIGCLPYISMIGVKTFPRPPGRTLVVPAPIPPVLAQGMIVAEPHLRGEHEEWHRTQTTVVPRPEGRQAEVPVLLPEKIAGDKIDVQLYGRPVPPGQQSRITRPVAIGRGARLAIGIGLDAIGNKIGASPVAFRVVAETADGKADLLRMTLEPGVTKGWQDYQIDLAAFTGQRVRFRLESTVVPQPGSDRATAFGFPLWGSPQVIEPRPRDERRNVILISLDTLRGDQLDGSLGGIPIMPELARRAQGGAVFESAYTAYPSTTAGHMTMLTGLYPATHGMIFATGVLSPQITTMPEVFARNGYSTVGVTEDAMLSAYVGFVRGFDYYKEIKGKTQWATAGDIERTFGSGLKWIEEHPDERFFMFLHSYQVHAPYEPPPEYDVFKTWNKDGQEVPIDDQTPRPVVDRHHYSGEARYSDAVLNRLLDRLAELGVLDQTIVAVTGDHGDEFGEHGLIGHAKTAYDEVLHVPLVLFGPGVPRGKRIDTPVSLIDLMPTLLDLVDLPVPHGLHGTSLKPLLRDEPFPAFRVLYAEAPSVGPGTGHRVAVRTAGFKWIASDLPNVPTQIYDLTTDPGEHAPLDDARLAAPGDVLQSLYRGLGDTTKGPALKGGDAALAPVPTPKPELDERTLEKLRQLGYID